VREALPSLVQDSSVLDRGYAIRFPGFTYGGGSLSPRSFPLTGGTTKGADVTFEDPDLLSGVVDAPPRLAMEMADLIRLKLRR
jgi:hypothetical protein